MSLRRLFIDEHYFRLLFYGVFATAFALAIVSAAIATFERLDAAWVTSFAVYVFEYWFARIPMAILYVLVAACLYVIDPAKSVYQWTLRRQAFGRVSQGRMRQHARRAVNIFPVIFLIELVIGLPVAHAGNANLVFLASVFVPIPLLFLGYYSTFSNALVGTSRVRAISLLEYRLRSFAVAEMSVESVEAQSAIARYDALARQYGKREEIVLGYLKRGSGHSDYFDGIRMLPSLAAHLLGERGLHTLTFHDRTMSALRVAFDQAKASLKELGERPIVALSDLEYPETIAQAEDVFGKDSVHVLELSRQVLSREPLGERVARLAEWVGEVQANVCVVSHVDYSTGVVAPLGELRQRIRRLDVRRTKKRKTEKHGEGTVDKKQPPNVVIICDGAQAFGHIDITADEIASVDFYAACSHKWALGRESLGILVYNGAKPRDGMSKRAHMQGRGFSTPEDFELIDSPEQGPASGTIDMRPYISSAVSLEEIGRIGTDKIESHNKALAQLFVDAINRTNLGSTLVPPGETSGMVLYMPRSEADANALNVELPLEFRGTTRVVGSFSTTNPKRVGIRFGFHFYHSEVDVLDLVDCIDVAFSAVKRTTSTRAVAEPA